MLFTLARQMAAASQTATLIVGGEKPFLHKSPLVIGGEIYTSLPAVNTLGARYETDLKNKEDGQKVNITPADGDCFTVRAKLVDGELMVPIQQIAGLIGADIDWSDASMTLTIRAKVKGISFDGRELHVHTSYPVTSKVTWWGSARKLILDIKGVQMPKPSEVNIDNSTTIPVRTGVQSDKQMARVVLDLPYAVKWRVTSPPKTSEIVLAVSGLDKPMPPQNNAPATEPDTEAMPMDTTQQPEAPPVTISDISFRKNGSRRVDVYVSASGPAKYETSLTRDPDELMVDIKHAELGKEFDDIFVGHDLLQGIHVEQNGDNARIKLELNRIVGFDVKRDDAGEFTISLVLPKGAGGPLAGRTIVIDPGHGGSATGAVGLDGSYEKDANLQIAKRVRQLLMDAGVCAVLTRDGDFGLDSSVKDDLVKRAACAYRHTADAFLSIHGNSVGGARCPTGLETYYHGNDLNGKALAYCVHSEITHAGLLPDLKVRSDFMLYQTGLGLLRNACERFAIPSALIEVGYVRHPDDLAKRQSPEFQQRIAEAIVRGFREYFEGSSGATRRDTVRPVSKRAADNGSESPRTVTQPAGKPVPKTDKPTTSGPKRPGEN